MMKDKIKSRDEIKTISENLRSVGKKIGFTSGAFDLLHAGHVDYLEQAKGICDVLIVGVNSDASVKKHKGEGRPIVDEHSRIKVVAALESVDYLFLFDETNNRKNIEIIRPDYYIKGGDYRPEELTSRKIVEKYGGKIHIIPIKESISTSNIIERVTYRLAGSKEKFIEKQRAVHIARGLSKKNRALFLDRDGTINEEVLYLHEPEKFKMLPHVVEGIRMFRERGYRIVIITNQPGIGLGYYRVEDFYRVNLKMLKCFSKHGILIDKIYFCPHTKAEKCSCRKPEQALIRRARDDLNLDLSSCVMIGDKTSDVETGRRAGMTTVLVRTGSGGNDGEYSGEPDYRADNILEAAKLILNK